MMWYRCALRGKKRLERLFFFACLIITFLSVAGSSLGSEKITDGILTISATCALAQGKFKAERQIEILSGRARPGEGYAWKLEGRKIIVTYIGGEASSLSIDIPADRMTGSLEVKPLVGRLKGAVCSVEFNFRADRVLGEGVRGSENVPSDVVGGALGKGGGEAPANAMPGGHVGGPPKSAGQSSVASGGIGLFILVGVSISLSILSLVSVLLARKESEENIDQIRMQIDEKADSDSVSRQIIDFRQSMVSANARMVALESRIQQAVQSVGEGHREREAIEERQRSANFLDFVAEASAALSSAASFDAFAARYEGAGYEIWDGEGREPPTPLGGHASQALLWVAHDRNDVGYVFPGYGMLRQLTLLTSDNGRYADERLGRIFKIENGPRMRAVQPAEVDLRTGKIRKMGVLQLPLE
jgi:hypothetical protein